MQLFNLNILNIFSAHNKVLILLNLPRINQKKFKFLVVKKAKDGDFAFICIVYKKS